MSIRETKPFKFISALILVFFSICFIGACASIPKHSYYPTDGNTIHVFWAPSGFDVFQIAAIYEGLSEWKKMCVEVHLPWQLPKGQKGIVYIMAIQAAADLGGINKRSAVGRAYPGDNKIAIRYDLSLDDVRVVAMHELGHMLGVMHLDSSKSGIMSPSLSKHRTFSPDDIKHIRKSIGPYKLCYPH